MSILERLKRLETAACEKAAVLYPADDDGFCDAVVGADHAEEYRHGDGFDIMKMLNDTAKTDWNDYDKPIEYTV